MPQIEVEIERDNLDFPIKATAREGNKELNVFYDRTQIVKITGSKRSFTPELLDALKLVYPYAGKPVESLSDGPVVHANGQFDGAALVAIYTVPAFQELEIVSASLCTMVLAGGGGAPYSSFHVYAPTDAMANAHTLAYHRWTFTATDALVTWFKPKLRIPAGWQLGAYANADASVTYAYIGVLHDARNR